MIAVYSVRRAVDVRHQRDVPDDLQLSGRAGVPLDGVPHHVIVGEFVDLSVASVLGLCATIVPVLAVLDHFNVARRLGDRGGGGRLLQGP